MKDLTDLNEKLDRLVELAGRNNALLNAAIKIIREQNQVLLEAIEALHEE